MKGGWTIGTATLEPFDEDDDDDAITEPETRQLVLSYQVCKHSMRRIRWWIWLT